MKNYFLIISMIFVLHIELKNSVVLHYCLCYSLTQKRLKQLLSVFAIHKTGIVAP